MSLTIKKGDKVVVFPKESRLPKLLKVKEVIKIHHDVKSDGFVTSGMLKFKLRCSDGNTYSLDGKDGDVFKLHEEGFVEFES